MYIIIRICFSWINIKHIFLISVEFEFKSEFILKYITFSGGLVKMKKVLFLKHLIENFAVWIKSKLQKSISAYV